MVSETRRTSSRHVGFKELDPSEEFIGPEVPLESGSLSFSKPSIRGGSDGSLFDRSSTSTGTVLHAHDEDDDDADNDDADNEAVETETVPAMVGILLMYVLPFLLKLSSTIPTMYLVVALNDDFGATSVIQGVVSAAFQLSRAFVIGVNIYNPILSVVGGSLFGVLGFVALALYPWWHDSDAAVAIFAAANCAVGLSNGFSALQIFAKQEYSHDMGSLRFALRRQSVVSGVACILSYLLGGEIYQNFGIEAIGYMGVLVMGCASIALGMYLVGRRARFVTVTEVESPKGTSTSIGTTVSGTGTGDSLSTVNDTSSVELTTTKGGGGVSQAILENENELESTDFQHAPALVSMNSKSKLVKLRSKSRFYSIEGTNNTKVSIFSQKSFVSIHERPSTLHHVDSVSKLIVEKKKRQSDKRKKAMERRASRPNLLRQPTEYLLYNKSKRSSSMRDARYSEEIFTIAKSLGLLGDSSRLQYQASSAMQPIGEDEECDGLGTMRSSVFDIGARLQGVLRGSAELQHKLEHQNELMDKYSTTNEVGLNAIVFIVASAFIIEAVTSGVISAIGPLYNEEQFGKGTGTTGSIFGGASIFGTAFTFAILSENGRVFISKFLPSPRNMYTLMFIISISTLLLVLPSFYVEIICIGFIIGFNEALWALLNEMEGAITSERYYVSIGPGALLVHKLINMVVALLAPILYAKVYWLPYTIAGGISLVFTIFFVWRVELQRFKNAKLLAKVVQTSCGTSTRELNALRMSFTTLETLSRMASVYHKQEGAKEKEEEAKKKKRPGLYRTAAATGMKSVRKIIQNSIQIE